MNELVEITHGDIAPARQSAATKVLMPKSFEDVARLAKMMSLATTMVGAVCRNNEGNCYGVIMQAARWGLDPFAISHECFIVNGNLGYGAKLIASVIAANAPIEGRLSYEYTGSISDRTRAVRVYATFIGDKEPKEIQTPQLNQIKIQNSPLWKNDPDQQLAYYGARSWARRHAPDIIMGVVTSDEIKDNPSLNRMRDVSSSDEAEPKQKFLNVTPLSTKKEPEGVPEAENEPETEAKEPAPKQAPEPKAEGTLENPSIKDLESDWMATVTEAKNPADIVEGWTTLQQDPEFQELSEAKQMVLSKFTMARVDELEVEIGA